MSVSLEFRLYQFIDKLKPRLLWLLRLIMGLSIDGWFRAKRKLKALRRKLPSVYYWLQAFGQRNKFKIYAITIAVIAYKWRGWQPWLKKTDWSWVPEITVNQFLFLAGGALALFGIHSLFQTSLAYLRALAFYRPQIQQASSPQPFIQQPSSAGLPPTPATADNSHAFTYDEFKAALYEEAEKLKEAGVIGDDIRIEEVLEKAYGGQIAEEL